MKDIEEKVLKSLYPVTEVQGLLFGPPDEEFIVCSTLKVPDNIYHMEFYRVDENQLLLW